MFAVNTLSSRAGFQQVPEVGKGVAKRLAGGGVETAVEQALMRGLAAA